MPVFQRTPILVPTDYSDASLQAIRVARSIAAVDSDITVVHVAMDFDLTMHPLTWTGGPIPGRPSAGGRQWQGHALLHHQRRWLCGQHQRDRGLLDQPGVRGALTEGGGGDALLARLPQRAAGAHPNPAGDHVRRQARRRRGAVRIAFAVLLLLAGCGTTSIDATGALVGN